MNVCLKDQLPWIWNMAGFWVFLSQTNLRQNWPGELSFSELTFSSKTNLRVNWAWELSFSEPIPAGLSLFWRMCQFGWRNILFCISYLGPCQGHIWIMLNPTLVKLPYKTTMYWTFSRRHQNHIMERAMEYHLLDHVQASVGPCWNHDWHILISRLSRALIVSRRSKFGPKEMYIECQIFKAIA